MPPLNLTAANTTVSVKAGDLVSSALTDLEVLAQGENAQPGDSTWGLENLQRRIDLINAQRSLIFSESFPTFNLPTNTQPIPIGPAATFNVPAPPVRIVNWTLILINGTTQVEIPGDVLTESEWAQVQIKNLASTFPTHLYYERDFASGVNNLFFWPVPTQGGNKVRLRVWNNLPQALSAVTALALPSAYWMFLLCSLASDMAPSYGPQALEKVQSEAFKQRFRESRNAIVDNNAAVPPLVSDAPIKDRTGSIPDFNYLTGYR